MNHVDGFSIMYMRSGKMVTQSGEGHCGEADAALRRELVVKRRSLIYFAGGHIVHGLVLFCLDNSGVIDEQYVSAQDTCIVPLSSILLALRPPRTGACGFIRPDVSNPSCRRRCHA